MNLINKETIPYIIAALAGALIIVFVLTFTASNNTKTEEVNNQIWDKVEETIN